MDLSLFVWDYEMTNKIPVCTAPASQMDLKETANWQTKWTSRAALKMPNKVSLHRQDTHELLGLMSYEIDRTGLAVEVIYLESAAHSNANLLHQTQQHKKYIGIARALLAYAASISIAEGFGGVLYFKAKTTELRKYYINSFGAMPLGSYDPFRLVIWEDAAERLINDYR